MNDLNKDIFIQTTIKTQTNDVLEKTLQESEKNTEKLRAFTANENYVVKIISLLFFLTVLFFLVPMIITGLLTKGWNTKEDDNIPHYQKVPLLTLCLFLFLHGVKVGLSV